MLLFNPEVTMYCPRCSQQQVSDEMRFCSRCGLPLSAVRELVDAGGGLTGREPGTQVVPHAKALRGMRKGVRWMLAALPLTLVVGLLTAVNDGFAFLILLPLLCFVAGFLRLLYGTFREGRAPRIKGDAPRTHAASARPAELVSPARAASLPPAHAAPPALFTPQKMKTAEMAQPPSVAENTTRLFDGDAGTHGG